MYKVMTYSSSYGGYIKRFVITDQPEDWNSNREVDYPCVVEFAVSVRYNEDEQRRRAREYCEYLNKNLATIPAIGQ